METCNVCGTSTRRPIEFGNVQICKTCFSKVNGSTWKREFDKFSDLETNRSIALQAVHREHFPSDVVFAVNAYFVAQREMIHVCDSCGAETRDVNKFGTKRICNRCYSKLEIEDWAEDDFDDNEELEECRKRILKIAQKKQYSSGIVDEINAYFNSKIEPDLLCCIDGCLGQKLKIYKDHCMLITSSHFDADELSERYERSQKQFNVSESMNILGTAASLISHTLPGGGLVRKGVKAAGSALTSASKSFSKTTSSAKIPLNVVPGTYKIDYSVYTSADFTPCGNHEDDIGFIRFYKKNDIGGARIFLFDCYNEEVQDGYKSICECMDEFEHKRELGQQLQQVLKEPNSTPSKRAVMDEIRELKVLLDEGVLTKEEFEFMKRDLLGMPLDD